MKAEIGRFLAGLVIVAVLAALPGVVAATPISSASARCGKGYSAEASEQSRPHAWHGLARGLSSMLDVILPPLAEKVVSASESKDRSSGRGSGLAKAERSLLTGAISAAISASLAALGSALDPPAEAEPPASSEEPSPSHKETGAPSSCSEGDGTLPERS